MPELHDDILPIDVILLERLREVREPYDARILARQAHGRGMGWTVARLKELARLRLVHNHNDGTWSLSEFGHKWLDAHQKQPNSKEQ